MPANEAQGRGYPEAMLGIPRLAIWELTVWAVVIPATILLLLVRTVSERVQPGLGSATAVTVGLGTLILPFSTLLFSHVFSAALAFGAFVVLFREREGPSSLVRVAGAGLLAGYAVTTEYPLLLVGAGLGLYALARPDRLRRGAAYVCGLVLGVLPLALYNLWAFGSATEFSYKNVVVEPGVSGHDIVGANDPGLYGLGVPSVRVLLELLFAAKGLFVLAPVLAAGVAGLVLLFRRGRRVEAALIGGLTAGAVLWNAGYYYAFGGWTPGPRFLITLIPFLALPLALAYRAFPAVTLLLAGASIVPMTAATMAEPLLQGDDTGSWFARIRDGNMVQTVVTLVGGGHGWLAVAPFLALVLVACALVLLGVARPQGIGLDWPTGIGALAAWALVLLAAPSLLRTDRASGEPFGAVVLVVLVVALCLAVGRVARGRLADLLPALPLVALAVPGFADHTKRSLAAAVAALSLLVIAEARFPRLGGGNGLAWRPPTRQPGRPRPPNRV